MYILLVTVVVSTYCTSIGSFSTAVLYPTTNDEPITLAAIAAANELVNL